MRGSEQEMVDYFKSVAKDDFASVSPPTWLINAAKRVTRSNEVEPKDMREILKAKGNRQKLAKLTGLHRHRVELCYFSMSGDMFQTLLQYDDALQVRYRKRLALSSALTVFFMLILAVAIFRSHTEWIKSNLKNKMLMEGFIALQENSPLDESDADAVAHVLSGFEEPIWSDSLRLAQMMLSTVFPSQRTGSAAKSVQLDWASAYTKFCTGAKMSEEHLRDLRKPNWLQELYSLVARALGQEQLADHDVRLASYLSSFRGHICSKASAYGAYGGDAVSNMLKHYEEARRRFGSELSCNGIATARKYQLQQTRSTGHEELCMIYAIESYLDSSRSPSSEGSYRWAVYHNNKADIYLDLVDRCLRRGDLYTERDLLSGSVTTGCQQYWTSKSTLCSDNDFGPLLDTAVSYLNAAEDFYPTLPPTFLVTRAQSHSLGAKYRARRGELKTARKELRRATLLINSAITNGFKGVEVFYAGDSRDRFYFDAYDEAWAKSELSELRDILSGRFPSHSVKF